MKLFLAAVGVLALLTCNAIESSRNWQRFKNEHGCKIVPRSGDRPRMYLCAPTPESCTTDTDCMMKFGGDGGPEPKQWRM